MVVLEIQILQHQKQGHLLRKHRKNQRKQRLFTMTLKMSWCHWTLKGRVDSSSLFNFFSNNMIKDNWSVVSKIKSPGTTIMVFEKTSRCAVITIRDAQVYTYVEIGVAPTMGNTGTGMTQTDLSE
jgi:hypothetical protein